MKLAGSSMIAAVVGAVLLNLCFSSATMADDYQLDSITVTAQKKEENVQDVPMSISVFSEFQLEDAGVETTYDLTRLTPNILMKNNYAEHVIVIRGISSFTTSVFSPTGYYVDEVSYPLHYMHNSELFDVERVEILKGPQGTLYGRNSESGVVNIVTRQPGNEARGKIFGEYADYNTFRSGASLSGPLVKDKLYLGLAMQYKQSDGYVENLSNGDDEAADVERKNGRATLRWTPSDRWDISFVADGMDHDDHGGYRVVTGPRKTDPFEYRHDSDEYSREDANGQNLRVKYMGDSFNLLSVTGLQHYEHDYLNDLDFWDDPADKRESALSYEDRQYSQELRISSPENSGAFDWLAGVYGFKEETDIDYMYDMVSAGFVFMNPVTEIDTTGYAVFGQGTYTLFNRLHLTAGLRLDYQELEGELLDSVSKETCDEDLDFDELLPKFAVAYDVSNDFMAYASASKGYIVGGYNYCLFPSQQTFTYDPEYTWNYETGIKSSWLNNKLMVNMALFYIDIDDKQVSEIAPDGMVSVITNAAKAHSQGVELEFQARPAAGLDLFGGVGYVESTFDDFSPTEWNETNTALIEKDYDDNDLPYAPRYTYNLGAQYRHRTGLMGRVDLFGSDKFYGNYANTSKQGSYETVNLRLGYEGEHVDLVVWSKNVFDEEYLTYVAPMQTFDVGVDGAPRTTGVTLTCRF